jgi:hypothetical protein
MSQEPQQDTTDIEDRCKVCHKPLGRCEDARDEMITSRRAYTWLELEDAVAGAEEGCEFCSLIVSVVARTRGQNHIQCTPKNKTNLTFSFQDGSLTLKLDRSETVRLEIFEIYTTGLFAHISLHRLDYSY